MKLKFITCYLTQSKFSWKCSDPHKIFFLPASNGKQTSSHIVGIHPPCKIWSSQQIWIWILWSEFFSNTFSQNFRFLHPLSFPLMFQYFFPLQILDFFFGNIEFIFNINHVLLCDISSSGFFRVSFCSSSLTKVTQRMLLPIN